MRKHTLRALAALLAALLFLGVAGLTGAALADGAEDDKESERESLGYVGDFWGAAVKAIALKSVRGGVVPVPSGLAPDKGGDKAAPQLAAGEKIKVPILMYHSFTDDPASANNVTVTAAEFERTVALLTEAGYTTIDYSDLIGFVYEGKSLPEKPVLISIDDGYRDNLDLAAPILEKYGAKATIAVIGATVGMSTYKDTGRAMTPHFDLAEAEKYIASGTIDLQSHTFDMHEVKGLDGDEVRRGVLRLEGESAEDYAALLTEDFRRSKAQLEGATGRECFVLVYPYGAWDEESDAVLRSAGAKITVTTDRGVSTIEVGRPDSLYHLKRLNVSGSMTAEDVIYVLWRNS